MENVVRLADYRRRKQRAVNREAPEVGAQQYYCTRCESGEFRLHATGAVHCAHCGALMANIAVAPETRRNGA